MTTLPLELWRKAFSINPWHFWGLANATVPVTSSCSDVLPQYSWQATDRAGRHEIAEAIELAVDKFTRHAGYAPLPRYAEKTIEWPRYHDRRAHRYPYMDASGKWMNVLAERYVQALGVESLALIDGAAAVVLSDGDGDGLDDKFTVTVPTTVTDPAQIALYFAAADRLTSDLSEWRIQPASVSIAGGSATITGSAWLLVKPVLYEGMAAAGDGLDPDAVGTLATTVAVYRCTTYQAGTTLDDCQAKLIYETQPFPCYCTCSSATGSSTDPASVGYAVGRAGIRDARLGLVTPAEAVYNAMAGTWSSPAAMSCWQEPDRVLVRFLAGYPLTDGQPDRTLTRVIARLAAAELGRPMCACEWANKEIARWQVDLARTGGNDDDAYAVSPDDLANPLGTRRGQVEAWKFIQSEAIRPTTLI